MFSWQPGRNGALEFKAYNEHSKSWLVFNTSPSCTTILLVWTGLSEANRVALSGYCYEAWRRRGVIGIHMQSYLVEVIESSLCGEEWT